MYQKARFSTSYFSLLFFFFFFFRQEENPVGYVVLHYIYLHFHMVSSVPSQIL